MHRIPEPELMNDPEQVLAYASADFAVPHNQFVELLGSHLPDYSGQGEVLDLGCGPCDVTRRFALAYPQAIIHAVDGAPTMLAEAEKLNIAADLNQRIVLCDSRLPELQTPQQHYQLIMSNSLLHHLHDPFALWNTILRHARPFAAVFIMDLMRPASEDLAKAMVAEYAADEPAILQTDFFNSLCAAFTLEEVQKQLVDVALPQLTTKAVSDRHMIIYGTLHA